MSCSIAFQNALGSDRMKIVGSNEFTDNATILWHIKSTLTQAT